MNDPSTELSTVTSLGGREGINFDIELLNSFLTSMGSVLLFVSKDLIHASLHKPETQSKVMAFAADSKVKELILTFYNSSLIVSTEMNSESMKGHSIGFLKKASPLQIFNSDDSSSVDRDLGSQIQIITLSLPSNEFSPVGLVHNLVQNSLMPMFNSIKGKFDETPTDKETFNMLLKKCAEFNLALMQCQQSVEVPEVRLVFDPIVKERVSKARKDGKPITLQLILDLEDDSAFMDSLVSSVLKWTQDISTITKMRFEGGTTTTMVQEISYWMSYDRVMNSIGEQIKSEEVQLTIEFIRHKRRFQVIAAFENDLNFKATLAKSQTYASFMKDFPINDLVSAATLSDIHKVISPIFSHMRKYPNDSQTTSPLFSILETVSKDLMTQMLKILNSFKLMSMPYSQFMGLVDASFEIFAKWDLEYNTLKDTIRRTRQTVSKFEHIALKERIEKIGRIRRMHENLLEVLVMILSKESDSRSNDFGDSTIKEVSSAFNVFLSIDVLELSGEGENSLINAIRDYDMKIDRVESQITVELREKLGAAQNATEMFHIFSKFNALFVRPRIRGAIQEYQTQLLKTVQKDIQGLRDKFIKKYQNTDAFSLSNLRDIPQVSGSVIWTKQIAKRLKKYMDRVESVLGVEWAEHPEGKTLKQVGETFEKHLNTTSICENWNKEISSYIKPMNWNEKIFDVVQKRNLELIIKFDDKMINLFKEIRNFSWLKVKMNASFTFTADDAKTIYPYTVSLQESIQTFNQITQKMDSKLSKLVASHQKDVLKTIEAGAGYTWNMKSQVQSYIKRLAEKVLSLEEAVNFILEKNELIQSLLTTLSSCELEYSSLLEKLKGIQEIVDDFNFKNFSNLMIWVPEIDVKIEEILMKRLQEVMNDWLKEFEGGTGIENSKIGAPTVHELKIQDQMIFVDPPIEFARFYWMQHFHRNLGRICSLPRLEAQRYEAASSMASKSPSQTDYRSILMKLPGDSLKSAYSRIAAVIGNAKEYLETWMSYQSLWEIDSKKIYESLGEDIQSWEQLLIDIRTGRSTFDNSETEKAFGGIIIDYRLVQAKINNKYDAWHREILNQFGTIYNDQVKVFFSGVSASRTKLEKINFNSGAGTEMIQMITELQEIKKKFDDWSADIERFRSCQKVLDRQRFQYPNEWLWLEQVEGEWSAFRQIFSKKVNAFDSEVSNLQSRVKSEEAVIESKIVEMEEIWRGQKPYSGDMLPAEALGVLNNIQVRLGAVKESYSRICKAKELLDLDPGDPQRLEILEEDVLGLKEVWHELSQVWSFLDSMKDMPMQAVVDVKLKRAVEDAQDKLASFPPKLRQYEAYEKMKARLVSHKKMNEIIIFSLKVEAMKARHWKILLPKLKLKVRETEITLGLLWSCDLLRHEKAINEVTIVARGEFVLESILRGIKEHWTAFELDLARYKSKCKLIKGWDELFEMVDEHSANITSMKISPYYKSIEEEVAPWDDKLQKIRIIFDMLT